MNFLVVILSYLLGSINFAYITARMKGIDISSEGSGNPGTSNVLRTLGKRSAAIVLFGDLLKGAIPIVFFYQDQYFLVYGLAAVVGHIYPVFYRFKGGKGVATYVGVYVATVFMNPYNSDLFNIEIFQILNIPVLAFFYFVIFKLTRVSAIASLTTVLITVSLLIYTKNEISYVIILVVLFVLILIKHSENIKRLREGKENKF